MNETKKINLYKNIIGVIIILLCVFGIWQCRLSAKEKMLGPNPAEDPRSVEVTALFKEAAAQNGSVPLSKVMKGGVDAYVAYIPPYSSLLSSTGNMFDQKFILSLNVAMTSDYIYKLVVFDKSGVLDEAIFSIPDLLWQDIDTADFNRCVKLGEVYIIDEKTLATQRYLDSLAPDYANQTWLEKPWDFELADEKTVTEKAFTAPSNAYQPDDFDAFFAEFGENPVFQLANTRWPLQVFHIDPEDEGLHVLETLYYTRPVSYSPCGRTLFPTAAEREAADLEYAVSLHDAGPGLQAAVALTDADSRMLYVYVFQWHNGWYLLEISALTYLERI